ncbi:hypothetical protein XM38_019210 [Halomicronema hongdechloris C2206]|uniref:Uncharacterized protein n=2 Tax=Halomicronema hongdechloris TaxID=1209493 RepID=A0A1Z3HKX7_9CYAN|nr:hypothetical protein XM38_019210 [Halomicronema hongdechloris C2206]
MRDNRNGHYALRLQTSDGDASIESAFSSIAPGLTQLVFSLTSAGTGHVYVNGVEQPQQRQSIAGALFAADDIADDRFNLAFANENGNFPRPWLGELHYAALYSQPLPAAEVAHHYQLGVALLRTYRQRPYPWHGTGLQLRSSRLWSSTADAAIQRYPAATLLPALLQLETTPNPIPCSLAVSPYLGLDFRPAQGTYERRIVSAELLGLNPTSGQLLPVASHLWEATQDAIALDDERLTASIDQWAQQTHIRLAPDSAIAILRLRELRQLTSENPNQTMAVLQPRYRFRIVPNIQIRQSLTQRTFNLRSQVSQLRFRQGQFGGYQLPQNLHPVELAPPQVIGVQPLYLPERPESDAAGAWPWGLSSLRLSVQYTQDQQGVIGPYDDSETLWWQAPQYGLQFRSALPEDGPTAGLPPYFRATAIKSLLPVLPTPPLPAMVDTDAWQPILPGHLHYFLVGDRPGAMLALRHQLLRQAASAGNLVSGSVPVQHRYPRPVPLPSNQNPNTALRTWASYFDLGSSHRLTQAPSDTAFFAGFLDESSGLLQPARGLELTIREPVQGVIDSSWDGRLEFSAQAQIGFSPQSEVVDEAWDIQVTIISGGLTLTYEQFPEGHYDLSADQQQRLQRLLAERQPGETLTVCAKVNPRAIEDGFYQTLTFPLRLRDPDALPLPLTPYFIHFEDPEYNRQLASSAAHAAREISLPGDGDELVTYRAKLACDRREYNPDSQMALRYDWDDDAVTGTADLTIQRIDANGISADLVLLNGSLTGIAPGRLLQFSLADLRRPGQEQPPLLQTGMALQLTLTLRSRQDVPIDSDPVVLTVTIVADPVIPTPDAAYALLRQRQSDGVECVRFAWGPAAGRIELLRADDLRTEIVRRRAVFQWSDTARPLTPETSDGIHYALQKIGATGATHTTDFQSPAS